MINREQMEVAAHHLAKGSSLLQASRKSGIPLVRLKRLQHHRVMRKMTADHVQSLATQNARKIRSLAAVALTTLARVLKQDTASAVRAALAILDAAKLLARAGDDPLDQQAKHVVSLVPVEVPRERTRSKSEGTGAEGEAPPAPALDDPNAKRIADAV